MTRSYAPETYRTARAWREAVLERDRGCLSCGHTRDLAAHHLIFRSHCSASYRLDPRNGIALCGDFTLNHCHRDLHDAKLKINRAWLPAEVVECLAEQGLRWEDGVPYGPCSASFASVAPA